MSELIFKKGDLVDVDAHAIISTSSPRIINKLVKDGIWNDLHGPITDVLTIALPEPRYQVTVQNGEKFWLKGQYLTHRVTLTPETDAVFRDILKSV
jgi:hypothetical protein